MKQPPRRRARLFAFDLAYSRKEMGINQAGELLLERQAKLKGEHLLFAKDLIRQTWENLDQVDELISAALVNWKQDRISEALNALFRISVGELLFFEGTDSKIIINEGIEICKERVTPAAKKIYNGTMHQISLKIRPQS